jgi:hypothetical protein
MRLYNDKEIVGASKTATRHDAGFDMSGYRGSACNTRREVIADGGSNNG